MYNLILNFYLECLEIKEIKIGKLNIFKWSCNTCDDKLNQNTEPIYNCFCGNYDENKKFNKYFDDKIIPHRCGCNCGFLLEKNKACNLPYHPGPHIYLDDLDSFFKGININQNLFSLTK